MSSFYFYTLAKIFICKIFFHLFIGEADEAVTLYRRALEIIKDSNDMAVDDSTTEKMRIDLAELLHVLGRYCHTHTYVGFFY